MKDFAEAQLGRGRVKTWEKGHERARGDTYDRTVTIPEGRINLGDRES